LRIYGNEVDWSRTKSSELHPVPSIKIAAVGVLTTTVAHLSSLPSTRIHVRAKHLNDLANKMTDPQLIYTPIKIFARIFMVVHMNRRNNLCHVFHEVSEVRVVMLEATELVRAMVTVVVVASLNQGI
jgi:hypothetical protein